MAYDRRVTAAPAEPAEDTFEGVGELEVAEWIILLLAYDTYYRTLKEKTGIQDPSDPVLQKGVFLLRTLNTLRGDDFHRFLVEHMPNDSMKKMLAKAFRFGVSKAGFPRQALQIRTVLSRGGANTIRKVFKTNRAIQEVRTAMQSACLDDGAQALDKFAVISIRSARIRTWIDLAAKTAGGGSFQDAVSAAATATQDDSHTLAVAQAKASCAHPLSEEAKSAATEQQTHIAVIQDTATDAAKKALEVSGTPDVPPSKSEVVGIATAAAAAVKAQTVPASLTGLDPEQLDAALTDGKVVVMAGAGSGKTTTAVARVAYLVNDRKANPARLFVVCFNRKAARELRERIGAKIGDEQMKQANVGTMHGMFRKFVVENGNQEEKAALTTWLMTSPSKKAGNQDQRPSRAPSPGAFFGYMARIWKECHNEDPPRRASNVIQSWVMNDITPAQAKAEAHSKEDLELAEWYEWILGFKGVNKSWRPQCVTSNQKANKQWGEFLAKWRDGGKARLGDFSDMILLFRDLLKRDPNVRKKVQAMFDHVIVDECVHGDSLVQTRTGLVSIRDITIGTEITSYENGRVVYKRVLDKRRSTKTSGLCIHLQSGRTITATSDHRLYSTPFAEIPSGQLALYLMYRRGFGFRIGTSKTPTTGIARARAVQEHADRLWVLETGPSEEILYKEQAYSLRWGVPTYIFEGSVRGCDQGRINRIFGEFGERGRQVLDLYQLSFDHPHWWNQTNEAYDRKVVALRAHRAGRNGGSTLNLSWTGTDDGLSEHASVYALPNSRFMVNKRLRSYANTRQVAFNLAAHEGLLLVDSINVGQEELFLTTIGNLRVGMRLPIHVEGDPWEKSQSSVKCERAYSTISANPGITVGETSRILGISPSTVTHHVNALVALGLVQRETLGRRVALRAIAPLRKQVPAHVVLDTIVAVSEAREGGDYYDLTMQDTGNFFANGILSHNCQDLNSVQHQIIEMMCEHIGDGSDGKSEWLVGDPKQSINRFVGARPELLTQFHGKPGWKTKTIKTNYRCLPEIVERANQLMTNHPSDGVQMDARPDPSKPRGQASIVVQEPKDHAAGALSVVSQIKQDLDSGEPIENYAILTRTNMEQNDYETACIIQGIPYARKGGTSFLKSPETVTVMSYFNLAVGQDFERMQRSLAEILNKPNRFFLRAGEAERIVQEAVEKRARKLGISSKAVNPLDLFDRDGINDVMDVMDPSRRWESWKVRATSEELENLGRALRGMRENVELGKIRDRSGTEKTYTTQDLFGDILNIKGVPDRRDLPPPTLRDVLMPVNSGHEEEGDAPPDPDDDESKKPVGNVAFLFQIAQPDLEHPETDPSDPKKFKARIDKLVVAMKDLRVDLDDWDREQQKLPPSERKAPPCVTLSTIHCSPSDEPILTTNGWVPIGQLDPDKHRLASYTKGCNQLFWGMKNKHSGATPEGYPFIIDSRSYSGSLITIQTTKSRTRVTPNHRVMVRFSEAFMDKYVVYLMRRGDWWRVGVCVSARRPYRAAGVGNRLGTEQADAGWILGVFRTREEALEEEARIQATFGVPGLTFESAKERSLSREQLHRIHDSSKGEVAPRARRILYDFGLDESCPLYTRAVLGGGVERRNLREAFLTTACNVLTGYMEFPVPSEAFISRTGKASGWVKPEWHVVSVTRAPFDGQVYSLTVMPHRYYVSGGAVVHNSVKGAQWNNTTVVMAKGVFPYEKKAKPGEGENLPPDVAEKRRKEDEAEFKTERQLAYVAMTRAAKSLTIVCPAVSAYGRQAGTSVFVSEAGLVKGQNVSGKNDPTPEPPEAKSVLASFFSQTHEDPRAPEDFTSAYDRRPQ